MLGHGNSAMTGLLAGNISLDVAVPVNINMAGSMARDATITSIAGFYSHLSMEGEDTDPTSVNVQIFKSDGPNPTNTFVPVGSPILVAPNITLATVIGATFSVVQNVNIPLTAQTRVLVVFLATGSGIPRFLTGFASAGIAFG
jgi:BclB C-terminal domain-containing protein